MLLRAIICVYDKFISIEIGVEMVQSFIERLSRYFREHRSYYLPDISNEDNGIFQDVRAYTMISPERLFAVLQAVKYVGSANLPGAIVECGVWRGGVMMAVAKTMLSLGMIDRDLYLFDTFEGMPQPTQIDKDFKNRPAQKKFELTKRSSDSSDWCAASIENVLENMLSTGYPRDQIHLIPGKVENTIPVSAPEKIAILRLDTDWFESTRHELIHLYPRLMTGGVLIIDDYGHWQGARKAVDDYFSTYNISIMLNRSDYTGRIGIKIN